MVLGMIVSKIIFTWAPVQEEMTLCAPVTHPVKTHVNRACAALFYCGVDDTTRGGVVREHRCWGLWMAHLDEGEALFFTFARVGVERSNFCLGGGRHDISDDLTDGVDWAIWRDWVCGRLGGVC